MQSEYYAEPIVTQSKRSWRDRWRIYNLTASPQKAAARNAGIAALWALTVSLAFFWSSWRSEGRDDLVIIAACLNATLIGLVSYVIDINFIKKQRQTMDEYVHQRLSAEDRVELHDWVKHGKVPSSQLHPAMSGTADFVHDVYMNATFTSLNWVYLWMALLGAHISLSAATLVAGVGDTSAHRFAIIAYGILLAIVVATRIRPMEFWYQPLSKKAKQKVAQMREQAKELS
jgi:hypothetical protein